MTNIEDELKRFYAENTPPIDPDEKHRVVEMVARASQKDSSAPTAESISFRRFVLTQVVSSIPYAGSCRSRLSHAC